jgi:dipeptidase E
MIARGAPAGYAADDGVALHFEGGRLKQAVSSRQRALAYLVLLRKGEVEQVPLKVRFLGGRLGEHIGTGAIDQ